MNRRTVAWLAVSVVLLLALALGACDGSDDKTDETDSGIAYPVPPSIPVAGESGSDSGTADTSAPSPVETTPPETVTDGVKTDPATSEVTEPATSEVTDPSTSVATEPSTSVATEPETDAPVTLSALQLQLREAALRVAQTDGVGIVSACTIRMSGNAGLSGEYTTDTIWRRVNGNCSLMDTEGLSGFILEEDDFYLLDNGVCVHGLSENEKNWLTENLFAGYVLPIDPAVVVELTATQGDSGTVVALSGISREAQNELFASLGIFASSTVQLNSATGAVTLNTEGLITDASFSMAILYEVEGEQLSLNVEYISTYLYDEDNPVMAPVDAEEYTDVSFEDCFGELIPDEPETEPTTEPATEPETEPDTKPVPENRVMYVTADVLRVRSSSDFQSETNTVGYLMKGTSVTILEDYGSYAVIEYKGERCYIGTKFLSETRPED